MARDTRSGIYQFKSPSGKTYIGSTVCFANRLAGHLYRLRRGIHHSPSLQAAFNKYGESALEFSVVLVCARDRLEMYEQLLLDSLKPAYNVSPTACSPKGVVRGPLPDAVKQKISKGNLGKRRTQEQRSQFSEAQKRRTDRFDLANHMRGKPAHNKGSGETLTFGGVTHTLTEWAEELRIPANALRNRVRRGWDVAAALTTPIRSY